MGKLVVDALQDDPENEIVGMSRDEQKIARMPKHHNVSYTIGDLRDKNRLQTIMAQGFDSVINLAALKCVDILEANPMEAIKTNVIGSQNLVEVAEANGCPKIVFTSTDKAVYPINAYGQSKALAEGVYKQYRGPCSVFRFCRSD
jgi:UDP-glucose 4-epimerase